MLVNLKIEKELLKELKIKAVKEDISMTALATRYIKKALHE